jgi:D-aspartate ligase
MGRASDGEMVASSTPPTARKRTESQHKVGAARALPVLLGNAGYYGTLAAVRSLGRAGVPVTTVDPSPLAPAHYSRYTTRHLRCPAFESTEAWVEWLLKLGAAGPRTAVYATSDDVSFALALHRDALSPSFALYQPDLETMMRILDKGQLLDHARAVGIDVQDTWLPQTRQEVERIAREVGGTLLVKPRTQVTVRNHTKGAVSPPGARAVLAEYDRFVGEGVYGPELARRFPEASMPMIQRYYPEAMEAIYSLSGFRDRSGRHFALLGAQKVLQRPRRLGIGLCFESAAVDAELGARVARLCERIGYYGVFELEFIRCGGRSLLIDMNARFYNQVVFDIARGLELPRLAYAGALGDEDEIARLIEAAPPSTAGQPLAFCNGFGFDVTIGAQRLFGGMSREDAERWRRWRTAPGRRLVDAVADDDDPLPFACDVAQQIFQYARHPRAFVKQLGRG